MNYMYMKNIKNETVHVCFITETDQLLTVYSSYCLELGTLNFFISISYVSWDITSKIYLFLTVFDNSVKVWEEKFKFFLL
jgi:hypothetical protein